MPETLQTRIDRQKEEAEKRRLAQEEAGGGLAATPVGIAGTGATPDQAKMAGLGSGTSADVGTPVAKEEPMSSLEAAGEQRQADTAGSQDDTLQTELGEKTFDDQTMDAAQERAASFSKNMESFGSLGGRVESLVAESFSQARGGNTLADDIEFDVGDVSTLVADGQDPEMLKQLLRDFSNASQFDPEGARQLLVDQRHLFKNPNSDTMKFITATYKNDPATLNNEVANMVANDIIDPDQVTFEQLMAGGLITSEDGMILELGITEDELQEVLGPEWKTMTPDQIGEAVEDVRQDVLTNQEKIEEQLADPNLPPQTRAALLGELKRMGAIGAVEYEQRAAEASQQAADSGKIFIGGEVQDVAELLQDKNIEQDVVNFLNDPTSAENQAWAKLNPEFADWLDRELTSVNRSKDALEGNLQDFTDIQESNEEFMRTGHAGLSPDVMASMFGTDGWRSGKIDPAASPAYVTIMNLPPGKTTDEAIKAINAMSPESIEQMKNATPAQLEDLNNTLRDPAKLNQFNQMNALKSGWSEMSDAGSDELVDWFMQHGSGDQSIKDSASLTARLTELMRRASMPPISEEVQAELATLQSMFDADKDGKIDDADSLRQRIGSAIDRDGDFAGSLQGGRGLSDIINIKKSEVADSPLYKKVGSYVGPGDNSIDHNDLDDLASKTGSIQELEELRGQLSNFDVDDNYFQSKIDEKAAAIVGSASESEVINVDLFNGPIDLNKDPIKIGIKNIKGQLSAIIQNPGAHPVEKKMAADKLSELLKKTTEQSPLHDAGRFAHKEMINRPMQKDPPTKYKHLFVKRGIGWVPRNPTEVPNREGMELAERWATWRNYAEDQNDMSEFLLALDGIIPDVNDSLAARLGKVP